MMDTVIHVLNSNAYSGAENVALSIIEGEKDKFSCIYVARKGSIEEILKDKGVKYELVDRLNPQKIRSIVKKYNPKLIHAHDFTAGVVCAFSFTNVPIISHLHNNAVWIRRRCIKSYAYLLASSRFKKILTVSDSVMNEYIFGKRVSNKVQVVGNPVNCRYVMEKSEENLENTEIWNSDLAFFGRLCEEKRPEYFVEVVNRVKEYFKDRRPVRAVMIGDGSLREKVEKKIEELDLKDNIKLYGFLKNPHCVIKQTKVVCMPSKWEGFGLTAFESLALGKPVIASPVGGLTGIVDDDCGYFCDTPDGFAEAAEILLDNEDIYMSKSICAVKKAEKLDNLKSYTEMMTKIYSETIK